MDFPGKSPGAGCHFLLQGIFLSQGLNLGLLHWQVDSLPLSHQGNPLHVHLGNFQLCDQLMVCRAGYSSDTFAIVCLFCGVSSKQRALFLPASTLPLEKAMAPHAGTLAWEIPWTEGPGGLQAPSTVVLEAKMKKFVSAATFPPSTCHEGWGWIP